MGAGREIITKGRNRLSGSHGTMDILEEELNEMNRESQQVRSVLKTLIENNLFLCDYQNGKMCLKNENDDIAFSFKLLPGKKTIESLRLTVDRLKEIIDQAFHQ
jgi:hypothetical protein